MPMKVAERPTRAPCVAPRGDTGRGVFIDHAGHGSAVTRPVALNGEEVDASMTTDTAMPMSLPIALNGEGWMPR